MPPPQRRQPQRSGGGGQQPQKIVVIKQQVVRARPPQRRRRRPPPSPWTMRAVVALLVFGLGWLVIQGTDIKFPSLGGSDTSASAPKDLPEVSIEGAIPCQRNESTRINLTSQDRLQACASAKKYAKQLLVKKHGEGEGEKQFECQDKLWDHESDWSAWALNPGSKAYGIAQILPSSHGQPVQMGDWKGQVDWGMEYIWGRYKTSCNAWTFWQCTRSCPRYPGGPVGKLGGIDDPMTTWY